MSLGKIFYKINEMRKEDLRARVDAALATFRRAEDRIRALQPPPSLERAHDDYLAAVELFQKSALEVIKMFDDGNDELLALLYTLVDKPGDDLEVRRERRRRLLQRLGISSAAIDEQIG